jgi:hypothetical protein
MLHDTPYGSLDSQAVRPGFLSQRPRFDTMEVGVEFVVIRTTGIDSPLVKSSLVHYRFTNGHIHSSRAGGYKKQCANFIPLHEQ